MNNHHENIGVSRLHICSLLVLYVHVKGIGEY